jgi:hypothetical protein
MNVIEWRFPMTGFRISLFIMLTLVAIGDGAAQKAAGELLAKVDRPGSRTSEECNRAPGSRSLRPLKARAAAWNYDEGSVARVNYSRHIKKSPEPRLDKTHRYLSICLLRDGVLWYV